MENSSLFITIAVMDDDEFFCGKEGCMNHEADITVSIRGKYGFSGEPDALRARVVHVAETRVARGVEFIPALDDLVDLVRASSGRARRASIDTVTKTVLSLFEGEIE